MEMSQSTVEIFKALISAEGELKNPDKSATNPHFKSGFSPLDEITDSIRPVLLKNGLGVIQDISGDTDRTIVSTVLIHTSGEWIKQTGLVIPLVKHDAHGACGAVTYARRYSLLAMLNIVGTDEDDDGNGAVNKPKEKQKGNLTNILKAINEAENMTKIKNIMATSLLREWTEEEKIKIAELIKVREDGFNGTA